MSDCALFKVVFGKVRGLVRSYVTQKVKKPEASFFHMVNILPLNSYIGVDILYIYSSCRMGVQRVFTLGANFAPGGQLLP
jgi:hypothetical protein